MCSYMHNIFNLFVNFLKIYVIFPLVYIAVLSCHLNAILQILWATSLSESLAVSGYFYILFVYTRESCTGTFDRLGQSFFVVVFMHVHERNWVSRKILSGFSYQFVLRDFDAIILTFILQLYQHPGAVYIFFIKMAGTPMVDGRLLPVTVVGHSFIRCIRDFMNNCLEDSILCLNWEQY